MEESIIVHFKYGFADLKPLHQLEDELEEVLHEFENGEYDGNEMAVNLRDGFLYFYGSSASVLYKVIEPVLKSTDFLKGAKITMNGSKETEFEI